MTAVLITDHGYVNGGISRVVFDSLRLLRNAGVETVLVCGSQRVDREALPEGVRVVSLGQCDLLSDPHPVRAMLSGLWNFKAYAAVSALLKACDPKDTVVHIHSWCKIFSPSVFAAVRKSGLPCFLTCHDYFAACPNGAFFDYVGRVVCHRKGGGFKCLLCNCDARRYVHKVWRWLRHQIVRYQLARFKRLRFATISDMNDKLVREGMGAGRAFLRLNNPTKVPDGRVNTIAGKEDFLFIGRASAEKGLALFADAVEQAHAKGVVVGDGPELAQVRAAHPILDCLGWKTADEVADIMRQRAAVLVFPSLLPESAGLTPLEAMALNIPCIIADQTAATEYIEDGKTGLLFKSGDVGDLARKIEMMKDATVRERMSENIRDHFDISKWSEEAHAAKLLAAYREGPCKIALMAGETFDGGLVATLMNYLRHVDRARFKFTFYIGEEPPSDGRAELERMGIEIVVTPSKRKVVSFTRFLVRDFRKRRFDILHANLTALNLFPLFAGWAAGIPVRISHSHSTAHPSERMATLSKCLLRLFSHAFVTDYFACTEWAGRWLFGNRTFDSGKVHVLRNAIDIPRFGFDDGARRSIRRDLGLDGKFVIGNAGRFVRQKNHAFLVSVFSAVAKMKDDARLLLLGKGPLLASVRRKVEELGLLDKVVFAGEHADMGKYYSAMDVFLFPTLFEGLGMVLVEAQANGLPCIASTEVPAEAKMTDLVELIPLSAPVEEWAEACLATRRPSAAGPADALRRAGYDIATAAKEYELLLGGT